MDIRETCPGERLVVTGKRQRLIRIAAGETHRPAGDDGGNVTWPFLTRIGLQLAQEHVHQILEALALGEDQRALKQRRGRKCLDRLQETAVAGIVDELADGGMARFHMQGGRTQAGILHEGERGAHAVIRACAAGEAHGTAVAAAIGKSHDRVGRAEIEAESPLLRHRHILVADRKTRPA
ncbi:hypothetical protein D3C78_1012470 [compost metagenome]